MMIKRHLSYFDILKYYRLFVFSSGGRAHKLRRPAPLQTIRPGGRRRQKTANRPLLSPPGLGSSGDARCAKSLSSRVHSRRDGGRKRFPDARTHLLLTTGRRAVNIRAVGTPPRRTRFTADRDLRQQRLRSRRYLRYIVLLSSIDRRNRSRRRGTDRVRRRSRRRHLRAIPIFSCTYRLTVDGRDGLRRFPDAPAVARPIR